MKKNFLTGLVILLPIGLTLIIVLFIINLLTRPFLDIAERLLQATPLVHGNYPFLSSEKAIQVWSQILILIALFCSILVLGLFGRWLIFKALVKLGDKIIHRIPFISKLYKTLKEVTNVFFTSTEKAFKQVVMVNFPNPSVYCVGFVSREAPATFIENTKKDLISVFLPTTPNPTTGYLLQFTKDQVIYLDMSIEDALKYIVSCGMVTTADPNDNIMGFKGKKT